jgi:hypothetical protein
MLKHSADPTVRGYLIDRLGPLGARPSDIIEQLKAESDVEIRYENPGAHESPHFGGQYNAG